jgi:hypothetical protein
MGWAVQIPLDADGLQSRIDWYPDAASFTVDEGTNVLTLLSASGNLVAREDKWSSFFEAETDPNEGPAQA